MLFDRRFRSSRSRDLARPTRGQRAFRSRLWLESLEDRRLMARSFGELPAPANDAFPGQLVEHFGGGVVHSVSQGASIASADGGVTADVDFYRFAAAVQGDVVVRFTNQGGDPEGDGSSDIGLRLQRLNAAGAPMGAPIDAATLNSGTTLALPAAANETFFFQVSSLSAGSDANYQLEILTRDREDDGGANNDRISTATNLGAYSIGGLSSTGYTITSPDRDFYQVSIPASGGIQTFIATVTMPVGSGAASGASGPTNLGLRVRNAAGTIIGASGSQMGNVDTVRFESPVSGVAVNYFLEVYSGSLGQVNRYDLSLVAEARVGTISGFAYDDINGDGFRQESEPARAGVTIQLNDGSTTAATATDAAGFYSFGDRPYGTYTLTQEEISDRRRTWPEAAESFQYVATLDRDTTQIDHLDFGSQQLGIINVVKDAVPTDPQDFAFTSALLGAFSLDDDGSESTAGGALASVRQFTQLIPGTYVVTETALDGWDLTGLSIVDPDDGSSFDLATGVATIDVDAGESITVTYTNTKRGSITVTKNALPDDAADFSFTTTGTGLSNFSLDDDGGTDATLPATRTFTNLVPGTYTITEAALAGWSLTNLAITESGGVANSTTNLAARLATLVVEPGEDVGVTFTNTKLGSITVVKDTQPDNGQDFSFNFAPPAGGSPAAESFLLDDDQNATLSNTKVYSNLAPGIYTISEQATGGWTLDSITVANDATNNSSADTSTRTATINVGAGEDITVTFVNSATPLVRGVKFRDDNANGSKQASEPGLAGFVIELYQDDGDGIFEPVESIGNVTIPATGRDTLVATATTDVSGAYKLGLLTEAVLNSQYFIRERQQFGFRETTAGVRTATYNTNLVPLPDQNFGNAPCSVDFDLSTVEDLLPTNEGILTLQLEGGGTFTVRRSDNQPFSAYDPSNAQTNLFTGTTVSSRSVDAFGASARADIRVTAAVAAANTNTVSADDVRFVVTVTGAQPGSRLRFLNAVNILTSTSVFLQIRGTECGDFIAVRDDADAVGASDAKRLAIGNVIGPLNNGAQALAFEGVQYKATIINPLFGGNPAIAGIQIFSGGGDDIVRVGSGVAARDITLQQSTIYLGEGNDFARVGGQRGSIFGEQGDDFIVGGSGDDVMYGGAGTDRLFGSAGPDRIFGDDGNDLIGGGDGNDAQLVGGNGDDRISGGQGNDRMSGDAGFDVAYRDSSDTVGITTCESVINVSTSGGIDQVDVLLRDLIDAVFNDSEVTDADNDPLVDTIDELLGLL